jgi:hypothetical protein
MLAQRLAKAAIHVWHAVTASIRLQSNSQLLQTTLNKIARIDREISGLGDEHDNRDQHAER